MNEELKTAKEAVEALGVEISKKITTISDAVKDKAAASVVEDLKTDVLEAKSKQLEIIAALDLMKAENARLKAGKDKPEPRSVMEQVAAGAIIKGGELAKNERAGSRYKDSDPLRGFLKGSFYDSPAAPKEVEVDLLKAASTMSTGYSLTGANVNLMRAFTDEPGVAKEPTRPLFITDLINTGQTDSHTIFWTERTAIEGGAGQVAEGAKFPLLSVKWEKKSATSKKTAVYAKFTEETLEDVSYVLSETQFELIDGPMGMKFQVENQVLSGTGAGENHLGIIPRNNLFARPAGLDTLAEVNNFDIIATAILQVIIAKFRPTAVVMHPVDAKNMELSRDGNGNYLLPPFSSANGSSISGIPVVLSLGMDVGSFLVADFKLATLFMKRDLMVKFFDQNEDDALYDLRTVTASLRAIFRIKTPHLPAFVYGTFAAAKPMLLN